MNAFQTYRTFESQEEAIAFKELLESHHIKAKIDESRAIFDTVLVGAPNIKHFFVQIPQDSFLTANAILEDSIDLTDVEVEPDYYLLSFTDEELLDIVKTKDEWGEFDYALAKKLLAERGVAITHENIKTLEKERVKDLRTPEKAKSWIVVVGYITAFLGMTYAIGFGLYLITAYRRMPDGSTVKKYDVSSRTHGKMVIIVWLALLGSLILLNVYQGLNYYLYGGVLSWVIDHIRGAYDYQY